MGPIGCPEESVTNYQSTLRKPRKSADLISTGKKPSNHTYHTPSLQIQNSKIQEKKDLIKTSCMILWVFAQVKLTESLSDVNCWFIVVACQYLRSGINVL
jgi:hypothetical protein